MSDPWITVRLVGGSAAGFTYGTLIEPPDEIVVAAHPTRRGEFIRVLTPTVAIALVSNAMVYTRAAWHPTCPENERIYHPKGDTTMAVPNLNLKEKDEAALSAEIDERIGELEERLASLEGELELLRAGRAEMASPGAPAAKPAPRTSSLASIAGAAPKRRPGRPRKAAATPAPAETPEPTPEPEPEPVPDAPGETDG